MNRLASAFTNESLHLTILPTEKCNYRCVYCYEDFAIGRMADNVRSGLLAMLAARAPGLKSLHISWFGGEPLLARELVVEVMAEANRLCGQYGAQLSSGVTTNAHLLTLNLFDRLCGLGVRYYQVTVDGPARFHDERRRLARGAGDFARIRANLLSMIESKHDFALGLRVHVDLRNKASMGELFDQLGPIGTDKRVHIDFERIKNLGKALPGTIDAMSSDEFSEFVAEMIATMRGSGISIANVIEEAKQHVCYAATPNSFVIRADGRVQMCTVALGAKGNDVGRLREDGTVELNERYSRWLSGWRTENDAALACPAKFVLALA